MKKFVGVFVALTLVASLGCATIVGDKMQIMTINSNPDQAEILIEDEMNKGVFTGKTPASVTLKKGDGYFHGKDYTVTIQKDGYSSRVVKIESKPGGWYLFGNILFGGLIGWFIVDPATGAMWTLKPENVDVGLDKQISSSKEDTLTIVLLKDVPENLRSKMVPLN